MRILLLLLCLSTVSYGQIVASSNDRADVTQIVQGIKTNNGQVSQPLRDRYAINRIHGQDYVSFLVTTGNQFDPSAMQSRGILVGARVGDIVSLRYPVSQLENIWMEAGIQSLQLAGKVKPTLSKVPYATRADSVWMGYNLPQGYTGQDVIVGVQDWGFDYTSPMFYDTLLNSSRILAAWDQFKTSGPAPTAYGYGTEYNTFTDLQNAGSDTSNIYAYATHGTHVAGIAGGSGAGTPYRGIAFECEYLFTTFLVDEAAVLDSWDWMYSKAQAAGKRLVVNMSWGLYHPGPLDGSSLLSQALNMYTGLGVTFVTSAGNNGGVNFHIQKDFTGDTLKSKVLFYTNAGLAPLWGQSLHMWGEPGESFKAGIRLLDGSNQTIVESPLYSTATTTAYVDSFLVAAVGDTLFFNLSADAAYPTNSKPQIRLRVKKPDGAFKVVLFSTAPSGTVHYWNVTELTTDVGNWGMPFESLGTGYTDGDDLYGIGTPACTESAITVGAYSSEYKTPAGVVLGGAESSFTSIGPLTTGALKPDISAPGVAVTSSISSFTSEAVTPVTTVNFNGRDYPFAAFSGTSMASPATVGVVALILDANPYLSPPQVKDIIIATARTDTYTGAIPPHDTKWGWGKVNAYAAVQMALVTQGVAESGKGLDWTIYPNPTSHVLNIEGLENAEELKVMDMNGRTVLVNPLSSSIDVSELPSGTYILRVVVDGKVEQRRFLKD